MEIEGIFHLRFQNRAWYTELLIIEISRISEVVFGGFSVQKASERLRNASQTCFQRSKRFRIQENSLFSSKSHQKLLQNFDNQKLCWVLDVCS